MQGLSSSNMHAKAAREIQFVRYLYNFALRPPRTFYGRLRECLSYLPPLSSQHSSGLRHVLVSSRSSLAAPHSVLLPVSQTVTREAFLINCGINSTPGVGFFLQRWLFGSPFPCLVPSALANSGTAVASGVPSDTYTCHTMFNHSSRTTVEVMET